MAVYCIVLNCNRNLHSIHMLVASCLLVGFQMLYKFRTVLIPYSGHDDLKTELKKGFGMVLPSENWTGKSPVFEFFR